jgi:hypothetical protein
MEVWRHGLVRCWGAATSPLCTVTIHVGKVGGLRGHRWLLFAVESKVVIHDMVSGAAREAVRTLWDGKAPTALAFLYANAARLLGFLAGDNANEVILGPVLAVGHTGGSVALINLTTLQVSAALECCGSERRALPA